MSKVDRRSSITGRYVDEDAVKASKDTTTTERRKPKCNCDALRDEVAALARRVHELEEQAVTGGDSD